MDESLGELAGITRDDPNEKWADKPQVEVVETTYREGAHHHAQRIVSREIEYVYL